jgi:hypothetical protein
MTTVEEFAQSFPSEQVLQQALAKLLSKIPNHTGVQILQGNAEIGKDIIFYTPAAFGERELNACVVKNTKITGNASTSTGARTVFNQAQQALDTPLLDENGKEHRVSRVFIITPYPIPPQTTNSIVGGLKATDDKVQFVSGSKLFELFKTHWPEYLSEEFTLIHTYADALTQNTGTAKEFAGLSFQYQLGTIEANVKRVYVQPKFHRFVRSYSLSPLSEGIPIQLESRPYIESYIQALSDKIEKVDRFMAILVRWEMCSSSLGADASSACDQLADALRKSWSRARARRAAVASSTSVPVELYSAELGNLRELNDLLESMRTKVRQALIYFQEKLDWVREYLNKGGFRSEKLSLTDHEGTINTLDEIARISGPGCMLEESEGSSTFDSTMLKGATRSLFIVAPAGFGKTTFCRWNALDDLERLLQHGSNILPVYIPLHQIGDVGNRNFDTFLRHAGVSALIPKDESTHYDKTRVYLDGLDEVPDTTAQKRIAQLAKKATENDPSIEIIITARDYAYGVLMTWLPRVHLSAFDDEQISELVTKWLDGIKEKIEQFFDQLARSRSLKEMMITPLLATLIVLVFKQTGKLPENKTRLYEIFVDLHNGGWDLAKGIQRPSKFSAGEKMFALKRIAAAFHKAKRREMLDSDVENIAGAALKNVDWNVLRNELLRDGLVIRLGEMISFSHHSFQEFLTAKHLLGDLESKQLNQLCDEYLKGSDWWAEVLCFFLDITGKPQELRSWIDERLRGVLRFARQQAAAAAETRASVLKAHLESSFPFANC